MSGGKRVWGIHSMDDNLFLQNSVIAIGWEEMGDLSSIPNDRDAFKSKYVTIYPDAKKGSISTCAGMLYRFLYEVQIGDYVVFPSKIDRKINIGIVDGPYRYETNAYHYRNQRKVKWLKHFPRSVFPQAALYEVGSAMTLFSVKSYADEFLRVLHENPVQPHASADEEEEDTFPWTMNGIVESTKDFILGELSKNLKGYDLEEFVESLLTAMGYRTTPSAHGGDHGIDIIAYKDELPPRILVQIKSQDGDIKETTIQSLKGAMREGDYGLFITLSDYTKNAKSYLSNTPIIRGISGGELVELILKYYDNLDEKYRKIIPLQKVYIPVLNDEQFE